MNPIDKIEKKIQKDELGTEIAEKNKKNYHKDFPNPKDLLNKLIEEKQFVFDVKDNFSTVLKEFKYDIKKHSSHESFVEDVIEILKQEYIQTKMNTMLKEIEKNKELEILLNNNTNNYKEFKDNLKMVVNSYAKIYNSEEVFGELLEEKLISKVEKHYTEAKAERMENTYKNFQYIKEIEDNIDKEFDDKKLTSFVDKLVNREKNEKDAESIKRIKEQMIKGISLKSHRI